ncbi:hypothetical protein [Pararhizobium sp. PWRC1-1]|uniref:hypothetical protein n=1 Tax=Pararhizobium sp. PWRC1-1 TaxID=2804566 RepID=UPI003CEF21DE
MAAVLEDELTNVAAKAELSQKLVIDTAGETVERSSGFGRGKEKCLPMTAKVADTIDTYAPTAELYREFER